METIMVKSAAADRLEIVWPQIADILQIPKNDAEYDRLRGFLDEILDRVGNDENHPLASLMETLGVLIGAYEEKMYPVADKSGKEILKFLINEHNLQKNDLQEIGTEREITEILASSKELSRELSLEQIKKLAARFHVSPAVFI